MCRGLDLFIRPVAVLMCIVVGLVGLALSVLSGCAFFGVLNFKPKEMQLLSSTFWFVVLGTGGGLALFSVIGGCALGGKRRRFILPSAALLVVTILATAGALALVAFRSFDRLDLNPVLDDEKPNRFEGTAAMLRTDIDRLLDNGNCEGHKATTLGTANFSCIHSEWLDAIIKKFKPTFDKNNADYVQCLVTNRDLKRCDAFCVISQDVTANLKRWHAIALWTLAGALAAQFLVLAAFVVAWNTSLVVKHHKRAVRVADIRGYDGLYDDHGAVRDPLRGVELLAV